MNTMVGSVEILARETLPEPHGHGFVIIPLSSGEAYIAKKGLPDRFRYYFEKEPDEEAGLMAVYNFLSSKIDRYRSEAWNIAKTLSIENEFPQEYRALAVTSIMVAQNAKRKGWPGKRELPKVQNLMFQKARALEPERFEIARRQASAIAIENDRYWVDELTKNRSDRIAEKLKRAIEDSDHQLAEV